MSDLIERLREVQVILDRRSLHNSVDTVSGAINALGAKDKLIAELAVALKSARVDVFNWLDEIYKFETETGAGEHPRLDAIDALLLRAKEQE